VSSSPFKVNWLLLAQTAQTLPILSIVKPCGPVNGPTIFIVFIHDLNGTWKALVYDRHLTIDNTLNTKIIIDDFSSWAKTWDEFIIYFTYQLDVCMSQNLSLSLKKSFFYPERMECVGRDVCPNSNRPAMSKHALLERWPRFVTAYDFYWLPDFLLHLYSISQVVY